MIRKNKHAANSYNKAIKTVHKALKNNTNYKKLQKTENPLVTDLNMWVAKAVNTNIEEETLKKEIEDTYAVAAKAAASTLNSVDQYTDYIAQSFFIDESNYPNGIFIHSIDVYFSAKDNLAPITLEVRPTVNGYPSSDNILKYSSVTLNPESVEIPTANNSLSLSTTFDFDVPVYVKPGMYAFTLHTNSSEYKVFISEKGKASIVDNKIIVNPYIGTFFQSQQGNTWTAEQTKDICFRVRRCIFETGSRTYNFYTDRAEYSFAGVMFRPSVTDFGETTDISHTLQTSEIDVGQDIVEEFVQAIEPYKETYFTTPRSLETADRTGANVYITLFSSSDHVSPLIDMNTTDMLLIDNHILPYSANVSLSELSPSGGLAIAKYISKTVILKDGFESNGLTVYLDVNRPFGTDIEVFCKIQNTYDYTSSFSEREWIKLNYISNSNKDKATTTNQNEYTEETYQNLELSYSANTGEETVLYTDFNKYAIKVVFYSDSTVAVPKIKNLRAISSL